MNRQLTLTTEPINETTLVAQRIMPSHLGAAVYFTGMVRGMEEEKPLAALEYEAFERMAEHQFNLIFQEIEKRWRVESVRVVHRIGLVNVNQASLWVEVLAAHREEAFAACEFLIDEMKRAVPIWKNPHF